PIASSPRCARRMLAATTIATMIRAAAEWVAWAAWEWICKLFASRLKVRPGWEYSMPTVLRIGPYRFQFYAADANEPPHVHVLRDDLDLKVWLDRVRVARNRGYSASEARTVFRLVEENRELLMRRWNESFNR